MTTPDAIGVVDVASLRAQKRMRVQWGDQEAIVDWNDGQPLAWSATCPHLGGPLSYCSKGNHIRCAWHGYAFDIASGACTTVVGGPWRQTGRYQSKEPPRLLLKAVPCVLVDERVLVGDNVRS